MEGLLSIFNGQDRIGNVSQTLSLEPSFTEHSLAQVFLRTHSGECGSKATQETRQELYGVWVRKAR